MLNFATVRSSRNSAVDNRSQWIHRHFDFIWKIGKNAIAVGELQYNIAAQCTDNRCNRQIQFVSNPANGKMLSEYLPILVFMIVGVLIGAALIAFGFILGRHRPDQEKNSPYECGFEAFEDARMKFDVRYYLVAILFILFDLEIAFLFPWAVALREIGMTGFVAMMIFLAILVVGFIYEWKKGALEWE